MRRIDRLIQRGGHASTGFTGPVKSKAAFSQPSALSSAPKSRPGPSSSKRKAPSPTPVSELESALSQSESEDEDGDDDNEEAALVGLITRIELRARVNIQSMHLTLSSKLTERIRKRLESRLDIQTVESTQRTSP